MTLDDVIVVVVHCCGRKWVTVFIGNMQIIFNVFVHLKCILRIQKNC